MMTPGQSCGNSLEFTPPKGWQPPEGKTEFDMVCTFKVDGDKLTLTKLGDTPMPEDGDDMPSGKQQPSPDMSAYAESLAAQPQPTAGA